MAYPPHPPHPNEDAEFDTRQNQPLPWGGAGDANSAFDASGIDPLADTNPIRPVTEPKRRGALGVLLVIGVAAFLLTAAALVLTPPAPAPDNVALRVEPTPSAVIGAPVDTTAGTPAPDAAAVDTAATPAENIATVGGAGETVVASAVLPTADPASLQALLAEPLMIEAAADDPFMRNLYDPFTIIPDRARGEVIQYEIVSGDTIYTIAERFGLKPESIAWSNDRSIIGGLRPGRMINIPPVDGALFIVPNQASISEIAAQFRVEPYVIIDSEFNDLFGETPDTVLPSGTQVMIPGGEAEQISWNPVVQRVPGASGAGGQNSGGGQISFSPGDPGSCGLVDNPGGGGGWVNPLGAGTYQWMRGFSSWHTGVDLSAPEGRPIFAANGGTVVFAGWNSFGYGYLVVLAHGAFTTLYGHMSAINVGCGQYISAGQVIGAVGSTGNSSGDHLHFEIRYNDVPQDPTTVMAL